MFGYVRPTQQLSDTEQARFQQVYCGMCHTLGRRYGLAGRMVLNYDLTFLAILLSDGQTEGQCRRCIRHPFKGQMCVCGDDAFDLAADMSVILTWWQIQDGIADHGFWRGLPYRGASLLLRRAYRQARQRYPAFDAGTRQHLADLAQLERNGCASLDQPADTFARLLSNVADQVAPPVKQRVLREFLYHLGRWIYLVDAADDLKDDVKDGSYNPLIPRYRLTGDVLTPEARQELALTLDVSVRAMAAAFELWDFGSCGALIESTVYHGLYAVGTSVLDGTFQQQKKDQQRKKGGHLRA